MVRNFSCWHNVELTVIGDDDNVFVGIGIDLDVVEEVDEDDDDDFRLFSISSRHITFDFCCTTCFIIGSISIIPERFLEKVRLRNIMVS